MIFRNICTFDVKITATLKVTYEFGLVCCIYKSRRSNTSTQTIAAERGKDHVVAI